MSHLGLLQHWITYLDLQDNKSNGSNVENNHDDDDDDDTDGHDNHDEQVTIADGDDVGGQIVHSEGTVHLDPGSNGRSGAENRCRSPERFELPFVGRIA